MGLKNIFCKTIVLENIKIQADQPIFSLEKPIEFNKGEKIDSTPGTLEIVFAIKLFRYPQVSNVKIDSDSIIINLIPESEKIIHGLAMDFNEILSDTLFARRVGIPEFQLVTGN